MAKRQVSLANRVRPVGQMLQKTAAGRVTPGKYPGAASATRWPESHGNIHWRLRGGAGVAPHGQVAELNQIPGVGAMTRVHAWTPPSETLLTRVTLPTRSRAKIQQALPYALEDQLIGEPDQLHFAYRVLDDASLAVAITARTRLQAWISHLSDAGLRPVSLCPVELALPLIDGSWSAAFHEDEIWVRTE